MESLTPREAEVLALIVEGLSDRDIAERLDIGGRTVRSHTYHLYSKLGVSSRTQAALLVVREQLRQVRAATHEQRQRITAIQKEFEHMSYFLNRTVELIGKLGVE